MKKTPFSSLRVSCAFVSLILLGATPAYAQLLHSWQFNETTGTPLTSALNAGPGTALFAPDIAGIATNGTGSLIVAYNSTASARTYADIPDVNTGVLQLDLNLAGWNFTGAPAVGPLLEVGFAAANTGNNASIRTAHIYFEADNVVGATFAGVAGNTGGNGTSPAASTPVAEDQIFPLLRTTPLTVRLLINFSTLVYTVSNSDTNYTVLASGTIASGKGANFVTIRALDDFTIGGTGGNLTIDSITVTNIPVLTPLQTWLQTNFSTTEATGNAADNADPDGDGVVNLIEYIADTNPNLPSANPVTTSPFTDVNGTFLTLTYPRRSGDTSLTYTVQAVSDLATPFTTAPGATVTEGNSSTYTDTVAIGTANPRRFLRLSVTR